MKSVKSSVASSYLKSVVIAMALLGWLVTGAIRAQAQIAYAAPLVAQSDSSQFVPFKDFVSRTQNATYGEYLARSETSASSADFDEMRRYILTMYEGVQVEHSFVENEDYFDCVPVMQQPTVRLLGIKRLKEPPEELPDGTKVVTTDNDSSPVTFDQFGNAQQCGDETIPMRRLTLEEMSRYPSLGAFLARGHFDADNPPADDNRRYATKGEVVKNLGGISEISLWDPSVGENVQSIAQQWYAAGDGDTLQTVEGGWIKGPTFWGKPKPVLFIYYTSKNYQNGSGCYNLECAGFTQLKSTKKDWVLGGEFPKYSVSGGEQHWFTMEWYLVPDKRDNTNNWWLYQKRDDQQQMTRIGYYDEKIFNGKQMTKNAEEITYGGETYSTTNKWPEMGSGASPDKGWKLAAFQSNINYTDTDRKVKAPNFNIIEQGNCYKVDTPAVPQAAGWGTYFFFGGPGGNDCKE